MSRVLPLPPGTYTLLPLIEQCDSGQLPLGPFDDATCRRRLDQHQQQRTPAQPPHDSAIDDDDDDNDDGRASDDDDDEFLVPFFVQLPPPAPGTRRSAASSRKSSVFSLTPRPTLRSSSPTPSYPAAPPLSSSSTPLQPIGFLRPSIVKALLLDNAKMASMSCQPVWAFRPPIELPPPSPKPPSRRGSLASRSRRSSAAVTPLTSHTPGPSTPLDHPVEGLKLEAVLDGLKRDSVDSGIDPRAVWAVGFEAWVNDEGEVTRKEHMDRISRAWKMAGLFSDQLNGWRNEHYNIYGPVKPFIQSAPQTEGAQPEGEQEEMGNPLPGSNVAFTCERAACALFGFATFGVHCTVYVEEKGQPLKIWVPRRSATKQTWPGKLDNTVAGGITAGDSPRESIVRECEEEASLSPSFVEEHLRSTSVVTYTYRTPEGWLQPEVQYCYDLKLPPSDQEEGHEGQVPKPNVADGEVESFKLMDVEEVVRRMVDGEFKPNCALVLVDFFLRHGYLTPESDARYLEVATRMRRSLILPGPA